MSNLLKGIFGDAASKGALGTIDRQFAMYPLQNPYLADIRMQMGGAGGQAAPGYYYPAGVLPNQAFDPKFGAAGGIEHGGFGNENRGHDYSGGNVNAGGGDPNVGYGHHAPIYHSEGGGGGHPTKGKGSSTAMTALTLLAFLFFLNILQNCLKEHMETMNPTVMVMTAGVRSEAANDRLDSELPSEPKQSDQTVASEAFHEESSYQLIDSIEQPSTSKFTSNSSSSEESHKLFT